MADRRDEQESTTTPADVLLANQLYYGVEAREYDKKNHVKSRAVLDYYAELLDRHVFAGATESEVRRWRVCDVGCGTGFLEGLLVDRVGSVVAVDATRDMLAQARAKFPRRPIHWVQADAQRLPLSEPVFDVVCSNAMLHHVFGFETVLAAMIGLLKPGGRLFLGYEPNAIPYRMLWPVLKLAAKVVPEHRDRDRIRAESGQERHPRLKDKDIHELSEFHIFQGKGLDPYRLQAFVSERGVDSQVHFSSVYQFALLRDSGVPLPVDLMPRWMFGLSGRLSLSFSLTGSKRAS